MNAKLLFHHAKKSTPLSEADKSAIKKEFGKIGESNLYSFPELYDLIYPGNQDLNFYKSNCKGKTLYFGVGTGRIFGKIAEKNQKIYGLDFSKEMISRFHERYKVQKEKIRKGDVLSRGNFDKSSFDTVIAPHSFISQFEYNNVCRILSNASYWLKDKGRLILDIFSPFYNAPFFEEIDVYQAKTVEDVKFVTYHCYDHLKQKLQECTVASKGDKDFFLKVDLNYYYYNELLRAFDLKGFAVKNAFGDFNRARLQPRSPAMIFELVKK